MLYSYDLTIPAGTTAAEPTELAALLQRGVITRVRIIIPEGCAGLVFTSARRSNFQVWPSNPDGAYFGDGHEIEWDEDYLIDQPPMFVRLFGWSPNARFSHTITWQFEMTTLDKAHAVRSAPGLLKRIADVLVGSG